MATMTDSEILNLAKSAVPEHIRPLGRIIGRSDGLALAGLSTLRKREPVKDTLMADLAKRVGAKLPKDLPDTAEVEFPEQTTLGLRTTVVHVRDGKVAKVIRRG